MLEGVRASYLTFSLILRKGDNMLESRYQALLIKRLGNLFPGCYIYKNDEHYQQGIPDLTILWGPFWAMLEVKPSIDSPFQANQEYWLNHFGNMSFAAMICPENEEEVLDGLVQAFRAGRSARYA